jgi:hypothetical protein
MIQLQSAKHAKRSARTLAKYLKALGIELEHGNALNAVAILAGLEDWNGLAAKFASSDEDNAAELLVERNVPVSNFPTASGELYVALTDLVEAIAALRDGALPDSFNHRAYHDAKVALAFCRPDALLLRHDAVTSGSSPRSVRKVSSAQKTRTTKARLLIFGADCRLTGTSWSVDMVIALPGQSDEAAICAAFLRRELSANIEDIDFWYDDHDEVSVGPYLVNVNRIAIGECKSAEEAVQFATQQAHLTNRAAFVSSKQTAQVLTSPVNVI